AGENKEFREPYVSNLPIYEQDVSRDGCLKESITSGFPHLESKSVDNFLTSIPEYINDNEKVKENLYQNPEKDVPKVPKFQPIYPTSHLKCFDDLFKATGLIGDQYKPVLKSVWYCLVSTRIAKTQLRLGSIAVDGRINILIFLPSGSGKTEIKRTIQQISEKIGIDYSEPTSFHPEQFVGKVLVNKTKKGETEYKKVYGYLSLDFVMIDEGKDLLTSKDPTYTESRKYLRLALDQYPNNTLTKKSVDIELENALTYKPHCCVCVLVQPFHIGEEIVLDGDFRRFITSYILVGEVDKTESYKNRIRKKRDYEGSINEFVNFLSSIEIPESFELTEEATDVFEELSILLINRGSTRSPKNANFIKMVDFTIQNIFLKFCAITALQENTGTIKPKHVELAFIDYAEILEHTYDYIENKILGNLDYGEHWNGAVKEDQEILKWLHENGATSLKTSKISIKEYQEKIMEVYNVKGRQAQRYKAQHENKGWIKSKQGKNSKVWITFKPGDESPENVKNVRIDKDFKEKYDEIIKKYGLK
ncbi:MAG: hypothetical protein K8E24_013750, partial [Methanobacterium paludis]|nr:hypothetical protein [Methanobacterium paludis]